MRTQFLLVLFILMANILEASNAKITDTKLIIEDNKAVLQSHISWENAWHNEKNHDALWVFFKVERRGADVLHLKVKSATSTEEHSQVDFQAPQDKLGLFIRPKGNFSGNIEEIIRVELDIPNVKILQGERIGQFLSFAIEMVYIPEGPFTLGEPGDAFVEYGGLYLSDNEGRPKGLLKITSENQEIKVGPEDGALFYLSGNEKYEGDQKGVIRETFPNGYSAFYLMKYEPTQGQYAAFLNTLTEQQSHHRVNFGGKTYYERRGSIKIQNGIYLADHPDRPCNYMSWDDAMAYADWAGLRPFTELEYVKAARGPTVPKEKEFPWNTSSIERMKRNMQANGNIEIEGGLTEAQLTEENRDMFGASFYWVMDLAGSMWERVITIGDEKGRSFTGVHGDGRLNYYGYANVSDWPSGIQDPGGYGFRGGGYYVYPMKYTEFNPYSPIAYRRYGGWSGGNRKEAYGARFARTAE